ncbi:MAG TPA: hypothetical protein VG318_04410 [Actinomycetota bacterium]|nr:hypothetical protein [Actinomycetota bacterium]
MRRLSLLMVVSALFVAGSALPAGSQEPQVRTDVSQLAMAQWKVTENGERTIYFAAGFTRSSATEWPFVGYVGRAECTKVTRGHHTHFVCRGRARPVDLAPGDFVVDPALQTGRLTVTAEGETHEVSWEASPDAPQPYFHQHAGTDVGAQIMTAMHRRASATGTAYGVELVGSRHGFLSQGLMVDVYLMNRGLPHVTFRDDGTMIFRQRLAQ